MKQAASTINLNFQKLQKKQIFDFAVIHVGICGGHSSTGTALSLISSVFPWQYHSTMALHTIYHLGDEQQSRWWRQFRTESHLIEMNMRKTYDVRFHVLTAASMKIRALWAIELCSLVGVYRRIKRCVLPPSSGWWGTIIITLTMEVVHTFETSVYSETTRRYIPEGSHLKRYDVCYRNVVNMIDTVLCVAVNM
jgi:hypothetical protein